MSKSILTIANPFNDAHIELFEKFEQDNDLQLQIATTLQSIRSKTTEQEYKSLLKNSNEINIVLFETVNGEIVDSCSIQGAKDIKTCNITFAPLMNKIKRPILTSATDYALAVLDMEEVFILIDPNDKNMISNLNNYNYENLGEENGCVMYLKEKEEQKSPTQISQLY